MPNSKKSASGGGSIRKKTIDRNGKKYVYWEGRATIGFDPGSGKQIQKTITGKTQKEVRIKLQELIRTVDNGTYQEPCKITLTQWLDLWTAEYLSNLKKLTQENYKIQCNRYLKPGLGAVQLRSLNSHMIQHFINSLSNGQRAQLSAKTIKNVFGVLHKALAQAVENELINHNPASACKLPKVMKPTIRTFEPTEISTFISEAVKDPYGNLFIVAMFSGIRQGELLGLSWDNIDFKNSSILIDRQLQCHKGEYFFNTPKNGTSRTIIVAPVVLEALQKKKSIRKNIATYLVMHGTIPTILCLQMNLAKT